MIDTRQQYETYTRLLARHRKTIWAVCWNRAGGNEERFRGSPEFFFSRTKLKTNQVKNIPKKIFIFRVTFLPFLQLIILGGVFIQNS